MTIVKGKISKLTFSKYYIFKSTVFELAIHKSATCEVDSFKITFKKERYDYWVSVGAQPSDTVSSLYRRFKKDADQAES